MHTLELDKNRLPTSASLATLSVEDWMNWLVARTTSSDSFTGEVLFGCADPLGIVRDSVARLDPGDIGSHFVDALLQLLRDYLLAFKSTEPNVPPECTFALTALTELAADVPSRLIEPAGRALAVRMGELYAIFERLAATRTAETVYARLLQAIVRLLTRRRHPLPPAVLRESLGNPSLSRLALHALAELDPSHGQQDLARFLEVNLQNGKPVLVDLEVESIRGRMGDAQTRALVLSALPALSESSRRNLLKLSSVASLLQTSEALQTFTHDRFFRYTYKGYLDDATEIPNWALDLLEAIRRHLEEITGARIEVHPDRPQSTWDEQAYDAADPKNRALDPMFLTPKRARSASVVPYAAAFELAVIYLAGPNSRELQTRLESWTSLDALVNSEYEIAYLAGIAAAEALRERQRELKVERTPIAELGIDNLLSWLLQKSKSRVLVLDIGMLRIAENTFKRMLSSTEVQRFNLTLHSARLPDPRPVLVGMLFDRNDFIFGELLRDSIEETLYTKHLVADKSSVFAKQLLEAGLEPLTPEVWQNGDFWVHVDDVHVPRSARPADIAKSA